MYLLFFVTFYLSRETMWARATSSAETGHMVMLKYNGDFIKIFTKCYDGVNLFRTKLPKTNPGHITVKLNPYFFCKSHAIFSAFIFD